MRRVCLFLMVLSLFSAKAQTSETNARLKQALKKFPQADSNQDGVLTLKEAMAFKNKSNKNKSSKAKAPKLSKDLYSRQMMNIKYGTHERNLIDLWVAKSDKPTPLMIFIHGGGFKGGDKSKGYRHIQEYLKNGISFASINYRYITENGIMACLNDSKRALQFLRYKASEFNLDKTKFALMGNSAGAGTSFWLAFTDDMANPQSEDPVERESTRVSAAIGFGAQCSYDFERWQEVMDIKGKGDPSGALLFYGVKRLDQLETKEGKALIDSLDMLDLLSKDDPPFYVHNSQPGGPVKITDKNHLYHHANHAKALKERALKVGVEHLCIAPQIGIIDSPNKDFMGFVVKQFKD
ncbi:alpha/beta hydrolase [Lentisphaera marina]|uniref:alpha/beta hydrolase n=1 Tax=Lentisphaera marina TaxID=1111041 RepID=UPI002365B84B|nr:alpha/beta hydrolase [Lentisphaera marina]MDD7985192.1 alpha/beta hydrolase [Lentisphaera marina]